MQSQRMVQKRFQYPRSSFVEGAGVAPAGLEVAKKRPERCEKYEYALICSDVLKAADTRNGASVQPSCLRRRDKAAA